MTENEGVKLNLGFRVDLLVGDKIVVEIKSVEALAPVQESSWKPICD
jgi:hypothetical protein